jgi:hypothetical protein
MPQFRSERIPELRWVWCVNDQWHGSMSEFCIVDDFGNLVPSTYRALVVALKD